MIDSIVLLLVFSIIYIFIVEIFTVLFRLTGLTEEKARFQVISLLTACGFTTSQSEVITVSKRRRRLASVTIMFGYIFSLIIVSVAVNVFLNMTSSEMNTFVGMGITLAVLFTVLFLLIRSKKIKIYVDTLINNVYAKLSKRKANNVIIMDILDHKIIATVNLTVVPECLEHKSLEEAGLLREHGIQVLLLTRAGRVLEDVSGSTQLQVHDSLIVFGREKEIFKLFEKKEDLEE